ncbi:hypothetical protein QJS04_geneDACA020554 [Acorus gramineus]|uniref:Uncharacterized protein n=1 Tax=Acorus gramineus TaxID=55184 RepID=A0AAV9AF33_ACOGR|nr:hypothetical protein QJS04_geneDACA020554 [Acorus gramineus]
MWRIRQKEHELENKMAGRSSSGMAHASQRHHIDSSRASSRSRHREDRDALSPSSKHRNRVRHSSEDDGFRDEESIGRSSGGSVHQSQRHLSDSSRASSSSRHMETDRDALSASSKHDNQATHLSEDDGFNDDTIEEFLHSRVKRGRGAIGSRMDEPGPYLSSLPREDPDMRVMDEWEQRVLGPEKPPHLRSCETFDIGDLKKKKRAKNSDDEDSSKKHRHSGKSHRAKEKDMCRKKRKEKSRHLHES